YWSSRLPKAYRLEPSSRQQKQISLRWRGRVSDSRQVMAGPLSASSLHVTKLSARCPDAPPGPPPQLRANAASFLPLPRANNTSAAKKRLPTFVPTRRSAHLRQLFI